MSMTLSRSTAAIARTAFAVSARGATSAIRLARPITAGSRLALSPRLTISSSMARGYATPSSTPSSSTDPSLAKAQELIEKGLRALEDGDLEKATKFYRQSIDARETSEGWHNLGNCEYHLQNNAGAIEAWNKSLALSPSADAHTNLASAYMFDKPPQPALAIKHLTSALELTPDDPEIAFNLAAVLESTGNLDTALTLYKKAQEGGIDRAAQNVRNVSAKIIGQRSNAAIKQK